MSFFHMVFHAFFKSTLFLATGRLMHILSRDQESRGFGGMGYSLLSSAFFTTRCIRLMGFPFALGFYSKDIVLGWLSSGMLKTDTLLFIISCCCTVAYRCRLVIIRFYGTPSSTPTLHFRESLYFIIPVVPIFSWCVYSGNYFFFTFFPPLSFSFFDLSLGILVIILGVVVVTTYACSMFTLNFLSSMSNITPLAYWSSSLTPISPKGNDPS